MKSFLKIVAGSVFGVLIAMMIILFIILGIAGNASRTAKIKVEPNSVLHLDVPVEIPDRTVENPFEGIDMFGLNMGGGIGLFELVALIEHARDDDNIKGIYLTTDFQTESFANLDHLRRALDDFRASGKFIIAYSSFSTQKSYLLSTAADELYLHPSGMFEFDGLAIETMYYKNLFDKLDIEPMPLYAGDYKSMSEPYRRTDMSDANREQLHAILEDLYDNYLNTISTSRDISKEKLMEIANGLLAANVDSALAFGLVDGLAFEDEVLDAVRVKMGYEEDEKISFVKHDDYLETVKDTPPKGVRERIAVVYAEGTIVLGEGRMDNVGGDKYMKLIRKIRKDDKVKAIVLRVNSPGGVAYSSDKIRRELELASKEKPLVVSMGNYAASGGYHISSSAARIFAEKNTITGSIGVIGILLNLEDFFRNKIGLTFDREQIGQYADFGNLTREWSDREWEVAENQVRKIYMDFKRTVAEGRGMSMDEVEAIAQGRVWTGQDALEIGLVDEIGDLDAAIAYAASLANLEEYRLKEYPREKDLIEQLMENMMTTRSEKLLRRELGVFYEEFDALRDIGSWSGIQMRMPMEFTIE